MRPKPIFTSEAGSFAYRTFTERVPKILNDIVTSNSFDCAQLARFSDLREEIRNGQVALLDDGNCTDLVTWNNEFVSRYAGLRWTDIQWMFAECYLYRRVLAASGYFENCQDPYLNLKMKELSPAAGFSIANSLLSSSQSIRHFILAALWGNRVDLSYNVAQALSSEGNLTSDTLWSTDNILSNDLDTLASFLSSGRCRSIAYIADNAGSEFCADLCLIDALLRAPYFASVTLFLKPQPFFVSDATPQDFEIHLRELRAHSHHTRGLCDRLEVARSDGRLTVSTDPFFVLPLFYFETPLELFESFCRHSLCIFKGDLNYRRLIGDAIWPSGATFSDAVGYFSTSVVALRTCKSDGIVGVSTEQAEALDSQDATWRVNGLRGVIQMYLHG